MSDPELHRLPPERRNGPPSWEVVRDSQRLGFIVEKHLSGALLPFYEAIVPHPVTGKSTSLELHTDRDERVRAVVRFADHPEEYGQHWS
ncbi:hypothetical protein J7E29_08435 [Streptomyces sp. ISL-90]|nr:hypothetical protein [Streptomyces sp. ISL-90]